MNAALIAAIVAGFVSLIGILANLYIARETRRTALQQSKLQLLAANASKSSESLKAFITETERVRICCWSLLGHLRVLRRVGPDEQSDGFTSDTEAFQQVIRSFFERSEIFEESWAPVKGEIPQGIEYYIRSTRHETLGFVRNTQNLIILLRHKLEDTDEQKKSYDVVPRLEKSLYQLLDALDNLISLIKALNDASVNEGLLPS